MCRRGRARGKKRREGWQPKSETEGERERENKTKHEAHFRKANQISLYFTPQNYSHMTNSVPLSSLILKL